MHKQTEYNRALRMHMQQPWQDILMHMFLVRDKECRERERESELAHATIGVWSHTTQY